MQFRCLCTRRKTSLPLMRTSNRCKNAFPCLNKTLLNAQGQNMSEYEFVSEFVSVHLQSSNKANYLFSTQGYIVTKGQRLPKLSDTAAFLP